MGDFEVKWKEKIDLSKALMVISFPTIGNVSSIAASYLVKKLDLKLVGFITSKKFVPAAVVENYEPIPPVRIYAGDYTCGPDSRCKTFMIILSEISPPEEVVQDLAEDILSICRDSGVKFIVTLVGLKIPEEEIAKTHVFGTASKASVRKMLEERDVKLLEKGMIGGMSGALLGRGEEEDVNILTLISEAHEKHPDSGAAARLLQAIDKVLIKLDMDFEPLLKEAEKIEADIKTGLAELPAGKTGEAPPGMYR